MEKNTNEKNFPPVVAVLGHVDHGKTTLLDTIRKTSIAQKEFGGITQKIGTSTVEIEHEGEMRKVTFIDTPGHEAFASMRGRGAQAADIGILVISSVDGVMPQTKESISLLKASGIPFIVALTMVDREEKNLEKVKGQLASEGVLLEAAGGDVPVIEVSAKENKNIKELLDLILLVWDLRTEKKEGKIFEGIIIESKQDAKAGPKATVVIKSGELSVRDEVVSESAKGRVRSLLNDLGKNQNEAFIGEAVEILGFENAPRVGDIVYKKGEKQIENPHSNIEKREEDPDSILSLIIIADTLGSLEAIVATLPPKINLAMQKTGDATTADVLFAKSIGASILGFNIKIGKDIAKLATEEKVLVKSYNLIYEMLDEIKDALEGKELSLQEEIYGAAKIMAKFPFEKTQVMGVVVTDGRIAKGDRIRLIRGEEELGESNLTSLRQGKESISKVEKGQEAGVITSPFLDFEPGDMIISHS